MTKVRQQQIQAQLIQKAQLIQEAQQIENSIMLTCHNPPDWDSFVGWGQNLLRALSAQAAIEVTSQVDSGADRHMLSFTFNQLRFSLNHEAYSDSLWIATEEPAATAQLPALLTLLQAIEQAMISTQPE